MRREGIFQLTGPLVRLVRALGVTGLSTGTPPTRRPASLRHNARSWPRTNRGGLLAPHFLLPMLVPFLSCEVRGDDGMALLFLYEHVLEMSIGPVEHVVRAKQPLRLPVVLSREEVTAVMSI